MITLNKSVEHIFSPANVDWDCDQIALLMSPFQEQIKSDLHLDHNLSAIELFLQLLSSMAKHFIEDEHWCYFDDVYAPEFCCMTIFEYFSKAIASGNFSKEELQIFREGLETLADTEVVRDYGCLLYTSPSPRD